MPFEEKNLKIQRCKENLSTITRVGDNPLNIQRDCLLDKIRDTFQEALKAQQQLLGQVHQARGLSKICSHIIEIRFHTVSPTPLKLSEVLRTWDLPSWVATGGQRRVVATLVGWELCFVSVEVPTSLQHWIFISVSQLCYMPTTTNTWIWWS